MRLSNVFKRVYLVDLNLQRSRFEKPEQLAGVVIKFGPSCNVVVQSRAEKPDVVTSEQPRDGSWRFSVFQISSFNCWGRLGATHPMFNGGTGPLAFPKNTTVPFLLTAFKLFSHVSLPTESNTTSTPSPPVTSLTLSSQFPPSGLR